MASTYLTWTPSNTGTRTTFTWSFWVKRNNLGSYQKIHDADYNNDANYYSSLYFKDDDTINMSNIDGGSTNISWSTSRKFRDVNAWYHIVVTFDTTNGTANDRIRCYVNGERETLTGTFAVAQGTDNTFWNRSGNKNWIGAKSVSVSDYLQACLSHYHFIDGTAYDATAFGQYDANGVWTIKTSPSVTYGTNGFFILKDGNSVTDQSGNSNNFTVGGGTLTKTEDNPSNVFATGNPLDNGADKNPVYLNGNNSYSVGSSVWRYAISTLGMSKGKFYMEQKMVSGERFAGVTDQYDNLQNNQTYAGSTALSIGYYENGNKYNSDSGSSYGNSYTTGDIIGTAIDVDNGKLYFSKNGTWQNSGVPTSGATGTGAITLPTSSNSTNVWFFVPSINNGIIQVNYGNGYFGTTAVSSAGTNASGNGIFEYDVPTGYTALSTKGLNL